VMNEFLMSLLYDKKVDICDGRVSCSRNDVSEERIVVSLTTSPKRIRKMKPLIDCLMQQTIKPDCIYLNLPLVFKRDKTEFQEIPLFITENSLIHINWCEDIGPATKVIPTAQLELNPETIIISIDDDIYYPPTFIETFLVFARRYPDSIITGTSYMKSAEKHKNEFDGKFVEFLEGYSGVLYRRKDFDGYKEAETRACYLGDDFYISNEMLRKGKTIVMIGREYRGVRGIKPLKYGLEKDALHLTSKGNDDNYKACSESLEAQGRLYVNYYRKGF